jgi:hypothetical protein
MRRKFQIPDEHLSLTLWAVGIAITLSIIFINLPEQSFKTWILSLLPNFIADLFFIPITVFLITWFLNKAEQRRTRQESYDLLGLMQINMSTRIAKLYIQLIIKDAPSQNLEKTDLDDFNLIKNKLQDIKNNTDKYIGSDFYDKEVKVTVLVNKTEKMPSLFDHFAPGTATTLKFITHFKSVTHVEIATFIQKYISVVPTDLREKLIRIENILFSNALISPHDHVEEIGSYKFAKVNVEELRKQHKEIASVVYDYLTHFEDFYIKQKSPSN